MGKSGGERGKEGERNKRVIVVVGWMTKGWDKEEGYASPEERGWESVSKRARLHAYFQSLPTH